MTRDDSGAQDRRETKAAKHLERARAGGEARAEYDATQQATEDKTARLRYSLFAGLDDVVSVTAYLEDIGDWAEFNEVYRNAFRAPYPTRTTVGARLSGVKVEISAIAHVRR